MQTLRQMRAMVKACKIEPAIISAASQIVFLTPENDSRAELDALFNWVRDYVRYTRDVHGVETLADPVTTMRRRCGDCDDQTTLLATFFEAVGYPTRFVVAGYHGADFEHVYLQVMDSNGNWIDADPTVRNWLGWSPPDPTVIFFEGQ
jgi:transglutaminase-like putative cysteine protease